VRQGTARAGQQKAQACDWAHKHRLVVVARPEVAPASGVSEAVAAAAVARIPVR
jgi:hypothetical protein